MEQSDYVNVSLKHKLESCWTESADKKLTTQVGLLLFDVFGSSRARTLRTVSVLSVFLISTFSPSRLQFLLGNALPTFLFFL